MLVDPANRCCLLWLIDRGLDKFQFRFYWMNLTQNVYWCRNRSCCITSLENIESLRLSCLLVCGDSTSRKWGICPPSHLPNEYGTRPFLRWVRVQGRSSHVPGISKNASDPVGIPLKETPQCRAINPKYKSGWTAPWGQRYIQWQDTPDLNRPSLHGRLKYVSSTGYVAWGWSLCLVQILGVAVSYPIYQPLRLVRIWHKVNF